MANAEEHAGAEKGNPKLLEKFREMNPDLREVEKNRYCRNLYTLLTNRHRHEGHCKFGEKIEISSQCFLDHEEAWQDLETGLPVIVAHAYCPHRVAMAEGREDREKYQQSHRDAGERLAERGLAYRASGGSWYYPGRCSLVVLARADVVARIRLPNLDHPQDETGIVNMDDMIPRIPWQEIMEAKLAKEAAKREELAGLAPAEERDGDHQTAFMFYCDTALIDREAGFDELAQEQLDNARRLLQSHPWLSINSVQLGTAEDRKYVFGEGLPCRTPEELQEILENIETPDGWDDFRVSEDEEGIAIATIWERGKIWGEATIQQGGNRNLWTADVGRWEGRIMSNTSRLEDDGEPSAERFIFESPEEAIQGAIKIWGRYDRLSERNSE